MAIPTNMRYVAVKTAGAPGVMHVAEGPTPQAGPDDVLIEVAYAGVNRPDCAQRAGTYPPPPDASPVLGLEVAGRIVSLGANATGWNIGDSVCALTPGGGYAEYCTTPAAWCLPVPAGWSLEQAAGIPENYFTVWNNVFDRAKLIRGEWFLVHGGTSGIGLTAIQLAKAFGATVVTTAGSDAKTAFCRGVGADYAFDAVGRAELIQLCLALTRTGGTTVCVGAPPMTDVITIPIPAMFVLSEKKLLGCALGSSNSLREIPRLIALWQAGRLDLEGLITARRPLSEINEAFADMRAGKGIRTVLAV